MNYAKILPRFWTGKTGRQINSLPNNHMVRVTAAYLFTGPAANFVGLYQVPLTTVAHHTGMTVSQAADAIELLRGLDFAAYDEENEFVWVFEMAAIQLNLPLQETDSLHVWVTRWWLNVEENPFLIPFYEKYGEALLLPSRNGEGTRRRPVEAPLTEPTPTPPREPLGGCSTATAIATDTSIATAKALATASQATDTVKEGGRGGTSGPSAPAGSNKKNSPAEMQNAIWVRVLEAAEKWMPPVSCAYLASTKLVRIDARGLYVVWCPSETVKKFMNDNAAQVRKIARQINVPINRFVFQEAAVQKVHR